MSDSTRTKVSERRKDVFNKRQIGKTFCSIGEELGVTATRARQIYEKEVRMRRYENKRRTGDPEDNSWRVK